MNVLEHLSRQLEQAFQEQSSMILIYLCIPGIYLVGQKDRNASSVYNEVDETIKRTAQLCFTTNHLAAFEKISVDSYFLLFTAKDEINFNLGLIHKRIEVFKKQVTDQISLVASDSPVCKFNITAGYTLIEKDKYTSLEQSIHEAIREAYDLESFSSGVYSDQIREQIKLLIKTKSFLNVFQPIVSIPEGKIFGYEALTRLPEGSCFKSPSDLFNVAAATGLLYPLEKVTREGALHSLENFTLKERLFLNINPQVINDPHFTSGETKTFIDCYNLSPENIIFEITEKTAIDNYAAFRSTLDHYRNQGFLIAIDDFGAGYSSLETIAKLQPDFIKLDMSLVRDVHLKPVLQALIETFLSFAHKTHTRVIAEGIETEEEFLCLAQLGITLGQGYFLARPDFPPPPLTLESHNAVHALQKQFFYRKKGRIMVSSIAQQDVCVDATSLTNQAVSLLELDPQLNGVVVAQQKQPVGLIMRDKLYAKLGTRFGFDLYMGRPATLVMDPNPLIIDASTSVEIASNLAMSRKNDKIYDNLILTQNNEYYGVVSVQNLLGTITQIQMETARSANPLTNLPGNTLIQEEITTRLQTGEKFAVIYCDLDEFKAYNDYYGFERGDQVLSLVARVLKTAIDTQGNDNTFLGHIGGDDFVLVSLPKYVEPLCTEVIRIFDAEIPSLYREEDRSQGYIVVKDRRNIIHKVPIMTISLAIVTNVGRDFKSILEIAETAAELKKYVKSKSGSNFAWDRRQNIQQQMFL